MTILLPTVVTNYYPIPTRFFDETEKQPFEHLTTIDPSEYIRFFSLFSNHYDVFSSGTTDAQLNTATQRLPRSENRGYNLQTRWNILHWELCLSNGCVGVVDNVKVMYRRRYSSKTYKYVLFLPMALAKMSFTWQNDDLDVCAIPHPISTSYILHVDYRKSYLDVDTKGTIRPYARSTPRAPLSVNG